MGLSVVTAQCEEYLARFPTESIVEQYIEGLRIPGLYVNREEGDGQFWSDNAGWEVYDRSAGKGALVKGRQAPVSFIEIEVSPNDGADWGSVPWEATPYDLTYVDTLTFRAVADLESLGGGRAPATACEVVSLPVKGGQVAHVWMILFTWDQLSNGSAPPGIAVEIQLLREEVGQ